MNSSSSTETDSSGMSNPRKRMRIDSIDLLRGIVMVIMLLDHTRDFVHRDVLQGFDPTDLARTNPLLFFTRWITHFCAPVFVFLAGTGSFLQFAQGKSKSELSKFLITRGLWLIALEFTVVRCAAFLNFDFRFLGAMQVIWVIGVSMIVLAALIHLPLRLVAAFGVLMILLHNLLDGFRVQGWQGPQGPVPGLWAKVYIILHQAFEAFPILSFFPSPVVFVLYPLIPWIGVMAAGYAFGALYQMEAARRRRLLLLFGGVATALFFILRAINIYGDPSRWAKQSTVSFTIISFFNVTKYPASLLFILMTLGPAFWALAWFEKSKAATDQKEGHSKLRNFFITFGRVPLFFYLLQWPMAHLTSLVAHLIAGKPIRWMFGTQIQTAGPPPEAGFGLPVVYICWIIGIILLYPLCKWFAEVKQRRKDWWLSYL